MNKCIAIKILWLTEYAGGMSGMLYFGNSGMWGFFDQWAAYVGRQSSSSSKSSTMAGAEGMASMVDTDDSVWTGWT